MSGSNSNRLDTYVSAFIWTYLLLEVIVHILSHENFIELSIGLNFMMAVTAAVVAGGKFLADRKRLFSAGELLRMAFYSMLIVFSAWVLRIGLFYAVFSTEASRTSDDAGSIARALGEVLQSIPTSVLVSFAGFWALKLFLALLIAYGLMLPLFRQLLQTRREL